MRKQKFKLPVKFIFSLIAILLLSLFLMSYIWKTLSTSDFFTVKQIVVRNSHDSFDYLKGKNIFKLNLNQESWRATLGCADCRRVRFARVLPNSLFVDFLKRQPVALVKFYKNFALDDQGFLFYPEALTLTQELPLIYGLETKIFGPKPGVKYNRPEIELALNIIKEFKANKYFNGFMLKSIDLVNVENAGILVSFPAQVSDFTSGLSVVPLKGFQARLGGSNIKEKMLILGGVIMQARKEWGNINYIDLRFKEPVIKLNNVKS